MLSRREFRRMYAPPKHTPAPKDYGVFVWRGDGRYRRPNAVRIFRSEGTAQRAADRLNVAEPNTYVVRPIDKEG